MSTDVVEEIADDSGSEAAEPVLSRRFDFRSKKFKIVVLLLVVMTVEATAIYLLVPQPALSHGKFGTDGDPGQTPDPEGDPNLATEEVFVDTFNCANGRASTGIIHVTFDLAVTVAAGQAAKFDQAANVTHKYLVRQAIVKVARSSNLDDLNDPNLSTMKRLIREEVNKVLRKSYIIEVVISDFKTMEQ